MPRNGSDVYSKPSGSTAVSGTTISSATFNTLIDDLVQDANTVRPIIAGGTGATTVDDALSNLGLTDSISVGDLRTETSLNALFVSTSGRVDDGGLDYGITIKSIQPGLAFVDRSSGAGQSLINGNGAGLVFSHDAVSNDGTIGGPSNTDTNPSLSLTGTQQRFFAGGVETAKFDSAGLTVGDVVVSSTGVSLDGSDITTGQISESDVTGLSEVILDISDTSIFDCFEVHFDNLTCSGLEILTSADGSTFDEGASDYVYRIDRATDVSLVSTGNDHIPIGSTINSATAGACGSMRIMSPQLNIQTLLEGDLNGQNLAGTMTRNSFIAKRDSAGAVQAIKVKTGSGMFISGRVFLRGILK